MSEEKNQAVEQAVEEVGVRRVKLTSMRKTIAKRLVESMNSIAQSSGSYEVDATKLLALREELVKKENELGVRITVTDLIMRAMVKVLQQCPAMNAYMTDTEMIYHDYVNLCMAIAIPGGLVSPVIRNAEKMSLVELSLASKDLTTRAKNKKLRMEDLTDGTFTISSMGPNSTGDVGIPLVSTPQAGIVQFGAAKPKPVVVDGEIVIRSMLRINVSYDHRIVDGSDVRDFNMLLKNYIENPETLVD